MGFVLLRGFGTKMAVESNERLMLVVPRIFGVGASLHVVESTAGQILQRVLADVRLQEVEALFEDGLR